METPTPRPRRGPVRQVRLVETEDRQRTAWEMRRAGNDLDTIARTLGYADHSGARLAVEAWRKKVRQVDGPLVEAERQLMAARLDALIEDLWPARLKGWTIVVGENGPERRPDVDPQVIQALLRVFERQARLFGTDAVDQREDEKVKILEMESELIARIVDEGLRVLGLSMEQRLHARKVIAERMRTTVEGQAARIEDRPA